MIAQEKAFKFWSWSAIFLFQLMALFIYEFQLVETNARSSQSIDFDLQYIFRILAGFVVLWLVLPKAFEKPSDFFLFIYGLFVVGPFVVFGVVNGNSLEAYHFGLMVIALPLFLLKVVSLARLELKILSLFARDQIIWVLWCFSIATTVYAFMYAPASAGFSLEDSYARRLEGRDVYIAGAFSSYAIGMTINGINPYLAFVAGERSIKVLLIILIFISIVYFYLVGTKAPIAYVMISFFLGLMNRSGHLKKIPKSFLLLALAIFLLTVLEWFFNNGYSLLAEMTFRRVNVVPGQVVSHYLDFITSSNRWSTLVGVDYVRGVTYLIGEIYYTAASNVNTNAFVYSLASGGVLGYLVSVMLVLLFYVAMDNIYRRTQNSGFLYIGFFYALLVTEQAATTAMLSSGFAVIFSLLFCEKNRRTPQGVGLRRLKVI